MKIATIISFIGIITMSFVLNTSPSEDIVKAFNNRGELIGTSTFIRD